VPYRPYPDRWRTLSYVRRQRTFYRQGWPSRPVVPLTGAREQLLAKTQALPVYQGEAWRPGAMSRRIARMTDQQVAAALAKANEGIAARTEPDESAAWAPATDSERVMFWYH